MPLLLSKFKKFILDRHLIEREETTLVAVSGGVDSVVLSHLFQQSGFKFAIAHCHFGLRGQQSDDDESFVKNLATSLNVDFISKKFETEKCAQDQGISIQMAARELRYAWFNELLTAKSYQKLATAHHANDQVETVLFNLTKGTGISGLRGIEDKNDYLIRPLLFAKKEEILQWAKEEKIAWREDVSNESDKYHRNHIRHHVVPELTKVNPNLEMTFLNNTNRFKSLENLLKASVNEVMSKYAQAYKAGLILKMDWFDQVTGGSVILEELLKPFLFNFDQCQNIIGSLSGGSGNQFASSSHELTVDRNKIYIEPVQTTKHFEACVNITDDKVQIETLSFTFERIDQQVEFDSNPNCAFLDSNTFSFPLTLRNWKVGDRFIPLGMTSEKKVSDFMIDEKIPVNLKKGVMVIESNGDILWVAGHRIDNRFKITSKTKSSLIIKMSENV